MRQIRFRGKRVDGKGWIHSSSIQQSFLGFTDLMDADRFFNKEELPTDYWIQVDPETVGQFIGLTDKSESQAYLGDIVSFVQEEIRRGWHRAVYTTHVGVICLDKYGHSCIIVGDLEFHIDQLLKGEIIGNIHDNPELITNK